MRGNRITRILGSSGAAVIALTALPLSGCARLDVFDWRADEPLPPVTGNVIATSSNRDLPRPADDDPLTGIEGQAAPDGTAGEDGTIAPDGTTDTGGVQ